MPVIDTITGRAYEETPGRVIQIDPDGPPVVAYRYWQWRYGAFARGTSDTPGYIEPLDGLAAAWGVPIVPYAALRETALAIGTELRAGAA